MCYNKYMKFVLGLLGIGVVLIIVIVLLVTRDPSPDSQQTGEQQLNLVEYSFTPASVTYTIDGEINAEEEHRAIRITVNRNQRTAEALSGYNQTVIKSETFSNTQAAYNEFLHALKNAGFSRSKEAQYPSEKGVCPLGIRYIYEFEHEGEELLRLWSTSCGRNDGSFAGNPNLVKRLFENQIPQYRDFSRGVDL